jgi:hypothetical protein
MSVNQLSFVTDLERLDIGKDVKKERREREREREREKERKRERERRET